ncbi:MAG: sugar phosphate isomerase/epimerase [Clostridia bacterium]|nr:sugar phosphate isomerase/epimerase [Clostridia bacterium]MBQ8567058.1 sugar phosphate isomerase/epimerase [Clostridia bacterium]
MKLSVLANLYGSKPLDEALNIISSLGVHSVEIGAGGYPGKDHCNPAELLADEKKYDEFVATFKKYDVEICALACHGNPVHPNKEIAAQFDSDMRNAILLAEKLGVDTIIGFSGCPGSDPDAKLPSWVTCPWPDDFLATLEYQWNEVMIPYWKEMVEFAKSHKVTKIALEMHPGFCVYNPETLLKLRAAVGDVIGANFDPSHLIWQGMNPVAAIRALAGAIYHVHAKDTRIDDINTAVNGVLDTKHYGDEIHRSWIFRTVGYGHGEEYWRDLVSALRLVGYDKVLSIEHEDSLMTIDEGLKKAVDFLDKVMIKEEKPCGMRWA